MTPRDQDVVGRLEKLAKQLRERARLYRLLNASEIGDEFERLAVVEVQPVIDLVKS